MEKIVICTGGFDPIHSGHISYLQKAKELGDVLYVGVNSDKWLERKKGRSFMPIHERLKIIRELSIVDYAVEFNDDDGSAKNIIKLIRNLNPGATLIFANGGDRTKDNIPEMDIQDNNLEFEFGVGGDIKTNSSSRILNEWKAPKTSRPWGYYRVLCEKDNQVKVKELTVNSDACLRMQRHKKRSEFWFVAEGEASVYSISLTSNAIELIGRYKKFDTIFISNNQWHRLCNEKDELLKIVEIQYGSDCIEEDIEVFEHEGNSAIYSKD